VLGCLAITIVATVLFVIVERRVAAPLVDLELLRNQVLVGATLAILIVAGTINALMYVLSLYFQDPAGFGMSALKAGLATLPAAAAMIAVTPLITPLAVKIGTRLAIIAGFGLAAIGFAALAFVESSWTYAAFVLPLAALAAGLGLANGPASSASTSSVSADQVGQASGISNMARYIGGSLFVAGIATVYNSVTIDHEKSGASDAAALAAGLSRASLVLAICSAAGIALALLMARHVQRRPKPVNLAAAAAASAHTIPTAPVTP
jgi:MFS family permease